MKQKVEIKQMEHNPIYATQNVTWIYAISISTRKNV